MKKRKGIILAGGTGSRLQPMTGALSKQVLPIYDKPMIYYPLSILMLTGISDILVISSPEHLPLIKSTLTQLGPIGVQFTFMVQKKPKGIADAMIIGEEFLDGAPSALVLGDNIFFGNGLSQILKSANKNTTGAHIFVYPVNDPERYGVLELDRDKKILNIQEKPEKTTSRLAVTGLYFFDSEAPSLAKQLKPSNRGELEITDLNKIYLNNNRLTYYDFGRGFAWLDAGTPSSLLEAANFVSTVEHRQGIKIAAPEEIALHNGWVSKEQLLNLPNVKIDNDYSNYLRNLAKE